MQTRTSPAVPRFQHGDATLPAGSQSFLRGQRAGARPCMMKLPRSSRVRSALFGGAGLRHVIPHAIGPRGSTFATTLKCSSKGRPCRSTACAANACPPPEMPTPKLGLGSPHRFSPRTRQLVWSTQAVTTRLRQCLVSRCAASNENRLHVIVA